MKRHNVLQVGFLVAVSAVQGDYVAALGRIEPARGIIRVGAPSIEGAVPRAEAVSVVAGQGVAKGELLATLDVWGVLEERLTVAQTEHLAAAAGVAEAEAGLAKLDAEIDAARSDAETHAAREALIQQRQLEAAAALVEAEANRTLELARHDAGTEEISARLRSLQKILKDEDPPRSERVDLDHQIRVLQAQLLGQSEVRHALSARLNAAVARAGATVDSARSDALVASAALHAAKYHLRAVEAESSQLDTLVDAARARTETAKAAVKLAETQRDRAKVTAPTNGTVLKVLTRAGELVGPDGICLLADLSAMIARVEVYIDDVQKIAIGQRATLSGPAFRQPLSGTVRSIEPIVGTALSHSEDPTRFTDRRVVAVVIEIDEAERAAQLSGALVSARIDVGAAK